MALMSLPTELRLLILNYLLIDAAPIDLSGLPFPPSTTLERSDIPLWATYPHHRHPHRFAAQFNASFFIALEATQLSNDRVYILRRHADVPGFVTPPIESRYHAPRSRVSHACKALNIRRVSRQLYIEAGDIFFGQNIFLAAYNNVHEQDLWNFSLSRWADMLTNLSLEFIQHLVLKTVLFEYEELVPTQERDYFYERRLCLAEIDMTKSKLYSTLSKFRRLRTITFDLNGARDQRSEFYRVLTKLCRENLHRLEKVRMRAFKSPGETPTEINRVRRADRKFTDSINQALTDRRRNTKGTFVSLFFPGAIIGVSPNSISFQFL